MQTGIDMRAQVIQLPPRAVVVEEAQGSNALGIAGIWVRTAAGRKFAPAPLLHNREALAADQSKRGRDMAALRLTCASNSTSSELDSIRKLLSGLAVFRSCELLWAVPRATAIDEWFSDVLPPYLCSMTGKRHGSHWFEDARKL